MQERVYVTALLTLDDKNMMLSFCIAPSIPRIYGLYVHTAIFQLRLSFQKRKL